MSRVGHTSQNRNLGMFAKLQKATLSFIISIRSHGTTQLPLDGVHEIWYLSIFQKPVEKIQVSMKLDKNNVYFTLRCVYIYYNILLNSA
jgi:hypothetical protein